MAEDSLDIPSDIFHLICTELAERYDFATLYNCLISSKRIAASGAVTSLYRIAHECFGSSSSGSEPIEDTSLAAELAQKNAILWRSITMSALSKTQYPYCNSLRVLDLRDLFHLLDNDYLRRPKLIKWFFSEEMAQFHLTTTYRGGRSALRSQDIVAAIGEVVINQTQLLEGLTEAVPGQMLSTKMVSWSPKLIYLRRLDFSDACGFADSDMRAALLKHCPNISEVRMYNFTDPEADNHLAAYFNEMPENTLTLFENMRNCGIASETCTAFNRHSKSLQTLKLYLTTAGILGLSKLTSVTNIEVLNLEGEMLEPDMRTQNKDTFEEIQDWLSSCLSLQEVNLMDLVFAPELLTPMFQKAQVQLHALSIASRSERTQYEIQGQTDFHVALASQQKLEVLFLNARGDTASLRDRSEFVNAICRLENLRHLEIRGVSDDFTNTDVMSLAQYLLRLEALYVNGFGYGDLVLDSLLKLKHLRAITFAGISRFTAAGLLKYISKLSSGNQGLALSLEYADPDFALSPLEEAQVSKAISQKIAGELKYQLWRDPDALDLDSDDSD